MAQELMHEAFARQQEYIERVRKEDPTRVERPEPPDQNMILGRIGVTFLPPNRPHGYLRLFPQDFIVEEILSDGRIAELGTVPSFIDGEDRRTLWVDLIKASISHPHAMTDLQRLLQIEQGQIGHSGIKDAVALTCQRLSLRGVTREQVDALQHPNFMVRPVAYGNGAVQPGDLRGNRFTITIRTSSDDDITPMMRMLTDYGFFNFFGPQRFGSRLISHLLGQKILQGDTDGALRLYFGEPGPYDVPLFREARESMREAYGEWESMLAIAQRFPFSMHEEIRVLEKLVQEPQKTRAALGEIREQVKMWVYAYGSWLINRRLSSFVEAGLAVPPTFAMPLASKGVRSEYREAMQRDGTLGYLDALKFFPFIPTSDKTIPTLLQPEGIRWERVPVGWVLRFALDKGAYATSCLSHVFQLSEGVPVPSWVRVDDVDALAVIGDGSLAPFLQRFPTALVRRDVVKEDDQEPV